LVFILAFRVWRLPGLFAVGGFTYLGAGSLGLSDRGRLAPGLRADLALWDIERPADLAYAIGGHACRGVVNEGRWRPAHVALPA
jgi:imidazolonepropionase